MNLWQTDEKGQDIEWYNDVTCSRKYHIMLCHSDLHLFIFVEKGIHFWIFDEDVINKGSDKRWIRNESAWYQWEYKDELGCKLNILRCTGTSSITSNKQEMEMSQWKTHMVR